MAQISRREFLKLLPAVPLFKVTWPYLVTEAAKYQQDPNSPNILFLIFDTFSAKHISMYGYQRETTPHLAALAERATIFHSHRAAANFTSPGTSSILTGTYPWTHRAFHLHGLVNEAYADKNIFSLLPDHYHKAAYTHNLLVFSLLHQFRSHVDDLHKTRELCLSDTQFADRLFFNDYSPAFWGEWLALRGGATPPSSLFLSMVDRGRRFLNKRQIEAEFAADYPRGIPNLHSLYFRLEDAIDWIGEQAAGLPRPYFGYFHLLPPHEPYTTHRDYIDIFADGWQPVEKEKGFAGEGMPQAKLNKERRAYDEYIAFVDAEIGRLFAKMEADGVLDNTYVVLTSDHGELFERGIRGHVTRALYDPLLHVPLMIVKPGQQKREDVFSHTSAVDLLPTFLHVTGQPVPEWAEGQILPTFTDAAPDGQRPIFALEAKSNAKQGPLTKATATMVKDDYKLIYYFGYRPGEELYELFDLKNDPEELTNLVGVKTAVFADMQTELKRKIESVNEPFTPKS